MRSRQGVLHCVGCRLDVRLGGPGADAASVAAEDAHVRWFCVVTGLAALACGRVTGSGHFAALLPLACTMSIWSGSYYPDPNLSPTPTEGDVNARRRHRTWSPCQRMHRRSPHPAAQATATMGRNPAVHQCAVSPHLYTGWIRFEHPYALRDRAVLLPTCWPGQYCGRPSSVAKEPLCSQVDTAARLVVGGTQAQQAADPSGAAAGPSAATAEQPAQRAWSAPAAAAKQVKRLHSPTEDAAQKLQRLGSGGAAAARSTAPAGAPVREPPRVPGLPRTHDAAVSGRSDGLPAPTVNGIPASLAGDGFDTVQKSDLCFLSSSSTATSMR